MIFDPFSLHDNLLMFDIQILFLLRNPLKNGGISEKYSKLEPEQEPKCLLISKHGPIGPLVVF